MSALPTKSACSRPDTEAGQASTLNPQPSTLNPQPSTLRSKANREPCSRPDAEAGETDEMQIELTDEILKITFRQFLMYAGVRCGR